jgi:pimeloyl-ACP methyl ester carboxylesterase
VKERIVSVEGAAGRLRVSDGGTGEPAVVFLHGLGGTLEDWQPQLDHLRVARRAIAYDQRGHGGSAKARGAVYDLKGLVADLEAVRRALGVGSVILVGHSMSGPVLTLYAGAHPKLVAGILYLDAIGDFAAVPREQLKPVIEREASPSFDLRERRAVFEKVLAPSAKPATRERVLADLDRLDPPAFAALRRSLFEFRDARARFAAYRGPAIAVEAADGPFPALMAGQVLGLPRTEVPGVSHWMHLDSPDLVNRALDAFLVGLPVARRAPAGPVAGARQGR